jgi:hypothetical protein
MESEQLNDEGYHLSMLGLFDRVLILVEWKQSDGIYLHYRGFRAVSGVSSDVELRISEVAAVQGSVWNHRIVF